MEAVFGRLYGTGLWTIWLRSGPVVHLNVWTIEKISMDHRPKQTGWSGTQQIQSQRTQTKPENRQNLMRNDSQGMRLWELQRFNYESYGSLPCSQTLFFGVCPRERFLDPPPSYQFCTWPFIFQQIYSYLIFCYLGLG